jgi:methionyl-tRNA formyltransferase
MKRIPVGVLDAFPGRVFNLHPALLRHYRGSAPIIGMVEEGTANQCGGVTRHLVSEGFDEGPIVARQACPRSLARDEFEWRLQIAGAAANLAGAEISAFLRGERDVEPQPAGSGSYRKLASHEAHLGPLLSLAALENRLRNFGVHHVHRWVSTSGRIIAVIGFSAVLGARPHQPDRRGLLGIDVDLADCRVLLRRRTAVFQIGRNIARLRALMRASRRSASFQ